MTTFTYTGAEQTWIVPAGVTSVVVECWGASGGAYPTAGAGGKGGYAKGTLAVTPGETLRIYVGGKGADGASGAAGGWNGGGNSGSNGAAGGGASDIRQGGSALTNRKIVAGGGGGGVFAGSASGGVGGGTTGGSGGASGGGGGTQTAGGPGYSGGASTGTAGNGGYDSGGGGGGGYFGGGAGFAGGGGSGYVGGVTASSMSSGVRSGAGQVVITYNHAPNAPAWVTPQNSTIPADADAYIELAFSDPDPGDSMSASNWKRWALDASGNRVGSPVTTYQPTPSTKLLIPAGTLTAGTKYEFQADTLDSQGAEGPYSASLFVTAANTPGAATILTPTPGDTIGTSSQTFTISAPNVDKSEWTLYADDGAGNIDLNTVLAGPDTVTTGDLRSHTFADLANNSVVWLFERNQYQGLWSQPAQARYPVSYTPPDAPQITVTPAVVITGRAPSALDIGITNPAGTTAAAYNDVYVDDGDGKGWVRRATMLATNTTFRYQRPRSGVDYSGRIKVTAVASNGTSATTVYA